MNIIECKNLTRKFKGDGTTTFVQVPAVNANRIISMKDGVVLSDEVGVSP